MEELIKKLYEAYHFFNRVLFTNSLPPQISIQIKGKKGDEISSLAPAAYRRVGYNSEATFDEIRLNPLYLQEHDPRNILSNLVHEMVHLYVYRKSGGNADKKYSGYHSKHWSDVMSLLGLQPTDTGYSGGKTIGWKIKHYIIRESRFDIESRKFIKEFNFSVKVKSLELDQTKGVGKSYNKTKYHCQCEKIRPVWASRPDMSIRCNVCNADFEVVR